MTLIDMLIESVSTFSNVRKEDPGMACITFEPTTEATFPPVRKPFLTPQLYGKIDFALYSIIFVPQCLISFHSDNMSP